MCCHISGSKSGSDLSTSLAQYTDAIVFQTVTVRDLQTVQVSSLPVANEVVGTTIATVARLPRSRCLVLL